MKISASNGEIEISDDLLGFKITRRMVEDFLLEKDPELNLHADSESDPTPYESLLTRMKIQKSSGPTKLSQCGNMLNVEGSIENLGRFAEWLDFDDDASPGSHHHYDKLCGDKYVHPDSLAAVIMLEKTQQQN